MDGKGSGGGGGGCQRTRPVHRQERGFGAALHALAGEQSMCFAAWTEQNCGVLFFCVGGATIVDGYSTAVPSSDTSSLLLQQSAVFFVLGLNWIELN